MNKQIEALKMAIEALEKAQHAMQTDSGVDVIEEALNACKEALESQEQEPVAWIIQSENRNGTPSEPYAMMGRYKDVKDNCDFGEPIPLYTHPVQPLTNQEIHEIAEQDLELFDFARAIEQALKEKNCGK